MPEEHQVMRSEALSGQVDASYDVRGILSSVVIALMPGGIRLPGRHKQRSVIPAHGIVDTLSLVQTYQGTG